MNSLAVYEVPAISEQQNTELMKITEKMQGQEQVVMPTEQFIHAGMYVRTCLVPQGNLIASALIKIPTVLIVSGDCVLLDGKQSKTITGYKVFRASCPRRAIWYAKQDTYITMMFATKQTDCDKCEQEFTDEFKLLQTRTTECQV